MLQLAAVLISCVSLFSFLCPARFLDEDLLFLRADGMFGFDEALGFDESLVGDGLLGGFSKVLGSDVSVFIPLVGSSSGLDGLDERLGDGGNKPSKIFFELLCSLDLLCERMLLLKSQTEPDLQMFTCCSTTIQN